MSSVKCECEAKLVLQRVGVLVTTLMVLLFFLESLGGRNWLVSDVVGAIGRRPEPQPFGEGGAARG